MKYILGLVLSVLLLPEIVLAGCYSNQSPTLESVSGNQDCLKVSVTSCNKIDVYIQNTCDEEFRIYRSDGTLRNDYVLMNYYQWVSSKKAKNLDSINIAGVLYEGHTSISTTADPNNHWQVKLRSISNNKDIVISGKTQDGSYTITNFIYLLIVYSVLLLLVGSVLAEIFFLAKRIIYKQDTLRFALIAFIISIISFFSFLIIRFSMGSSVQTITSSSQSETF